MSTLRGWPSFPAELPAFDPDDVPAEPHELFLGWLHDAGVGGLAPHAMTLSTVDEDGLPDARVVILKDVDADGWYFATSAHSPKGHQLGRCPQAALTFFWPHRGRQVRIRGTVVPASAAVSEADFRARPYESKVETSIGRQSEVLADETDLERAAEAARRRVTAEPDRVPDGWTRYRLNAGLVEFWQGSHDRRHIRLRYFHDEEWHTERLWP